MRTKRQRALKKRWIAALQNGHYPQAQGKLMKGHKEGFCCLGVLCNIMNPRGWDQDGIWRLDPSNVDSALFSGSGCLPEPLREYVGMTDLHHKVLVDMNDGTGDFLDNPQSFRKIAAYIEKNL